MAAALAEVVAAHHARIAGAVIATVTDWQVAEDALQDACERALTAWVRDGIPANPAGWLVTTARRRGTDLHRGARPARRRPTATGRPWSAGGWPGTPGTGPGSATTGCAWS